MCFITSFGNIVLVGISSHQQCKRWGCLLVRQWSLVWEREGSVKQRRSESEHDLHSVSIRPRYLPGEFFCIYVFLSMHLSSKHKLRIMPEGQILTPLMNRMWQLIAANASCVVAGEFNHCDIRKNIYTINSIFRFQPGGTTPCCLGL